jgi:hypothetical protein
MPAAQGDHDRVLRALQPLVGPAERQGVDEPGFWPWQDLYGEALVSAGRLAEAETFLRPREGGGSPARARLDDRRARQGFAGGLRPRKGGFLPPRRPSAEALAELESAAAVPVRAGGARLWPGVAACGPAPRCRRHRRWPADQLAMLRGAAAS